MPTKTLLLAAYLLLQQAISMAQPGSYRFRHWKEVDGLAANNCLSLLQDGKGYVWIGTINGLTGFSGTQLWTPQKDDGEVADISGDIRDLVMDGDSVIWAVSYESGLIAIDNRKTGKDRISSYHPDNTPGGPPQLNLNKLLDDGNGTLWIGSESKGLFRFNKKEKVFTQIPLDHPYSDFELTIRSLYNDGQGKLWVGIINGLFIVDLTTGICTYPKISSPALNYAHAPTIRKFCYWNTDTLVIATDRGAHFYIQSQHSIHPVFALKDSNTLRTEEYNDVLRFSENELWFASLDKGLMMINPGTGNYRYSYQQSPHNDVIPPITVNRLLRDKDNNIWIAHPKGLSFYNAAIQEFKNTPVQFYPNIPFRRHYIVTGKNGLIYYAKGEQVYKQYAGTEKEMIEIPKLRQAKLIAEYPGKGLFVQFHHGFFLYNEQTTELKRLPLKNAVADNGENLLQLELEEIMFDTLDGRTVVWMTGLYTRSLYRYETNTGELISYDRTIPEDAVSKNYGYWLTSIQKDKNNGLWIGSRNRGIFYLPDKRKNAVINYQTDSREYFFPGNHINDLYFDTHQQLWATVKGVGLVKINTQPFRYQVYSRQQGLANAFLNRIQEDRNGNLWISSQDGLFCYYPGTQHFRLFSSLDGIRNPAFDLGTAKDQQGHLYFSAEDNLIYFNPLAIPQKNQAKRLFWRSISTASGMVTNIPDSGVELKAGENSFSVDFDLLDFEIPRGHYFRYRLKGFDEEWQTLHDQYHIQYRHVPGNKYVLELEEIGNDATAANRLVLPLQLSNHYYEQTWFKLIVALAALAIASLIVVTYTRRRLAMQQLAFEKQRAVEMERLRISTELHDDLGGELSTIHLMTELLRSPDFIEKNEHYLSSISEKSKDLVQSMNEIVWSLNHNNDDLAGLLAYMRQYASRFLDDAGIELQFDQPIAFPYHEISGHRRRNLFLVIKEALHNVVKHAGATRVLIDVKVSDTELSITIKDNGQGGSAKPQTNGSGNGLHNMQERMKSIGGRFSRVSGEGTTILVVAPLSSTSNKSTISHNA